MRPCVLFDLGDTLLTRRPHLMEELERLCRSLGRSGCMHQVQRAYASAEAWTGRQIQLENETNERMPDDEFNRNICSIYLEALGLQQAQAERVQEILDANPTRPEVCRNGARQVLEQLRDMGVHMGVVSNNRASVLGTLERLGLCSFFLEITISEVVGLYKPDPRILLHACAQMRVSPADTLYVGDHPFDILCAHKAGLRAVFCPVSPYVIVPEPFGAPDWTIGSLQELPELIQTLV